MRSIERDDELGKEGRVEGYQVQEKLGDAQQGERSSRESSLYPAYRAS